MDLDFTRIPQNSRTIIFERFNDGGEISKGVKVKNLCDVIAGKTADEAIKDVNKELCVKSFEEFKTKFKPTVYEVHKTDENGYPNITYSLEYEDDGCHHAITLCNHEFYKAVHDIAITKSTSGTNNDEVNYEKLFEALDPNRIYSRARKRRERVNQYIANAIEAKEKGNPDGVRDWMLKAKEIFDSVKDEYSGSALRLLPIAVKDTEKKLEFLGVNDDDESNKKTSLPCSIKWDSEGNLVAMMPKSSDSENKIKPEVLAIEQKEEQIRRISQKNWETTVDSITEGNVNKKLFLSVYSEPEKFSLNTLSPDKLDEVRGRLQNDKDKYGNYYIAAQQSFCNTVGYLVQKVASLEQFFIHASNEKGIVESGVIIANCTISDIVNDDENNGNFKNYLKAVKNTEDRIWFAILPSSADMYNKWTVSSSAFTPEYDDLFDVGNYNNNASSNSDKNKLKVQITDISSIALILADCGILSFFNFNACEETSFKTFGASVDILEKYKTETAAITKLALNESTAQVPSSLVLAFPNFTIIPKEKRELKEIVNGKDLYVPPIYIDAAYVAAGTIVATQNTIIQKSKFGNRVKAGNPFIRFDLENDVYSKAFITKFNSESRLNMDDDLVVRLRGKEGNSFCFRSDTLEPNAFVFTARTLNAKPIYCFITQQYLSQLASRSRIDGISKAKEYARHITNMMINDVESSIVNNILQPGEKFEYDEYDNSLNICFNGIDEPQPLKVNFTNKD